MLRSAIWDASGGVVKGRDFGCLSGSVKKRDFGCLSGGDKVSVPDPDASVSGTDTRIRNSGIY